MNDIQQPMPAEQPPQIPITPPIQPEPKSNKRLILKISVVILLLFVGSSVAYALLSNKSTDSQAHQSNKAQSSQQDPEVSYSERWIYTNDQEKQVYLYNSTDNSSTPLIKLAEDEQVGVSPDGKTLVRTRKNVVETANSSEQPKFKQIYADTDQLTSVSATWLPDSSGFIVVAAKLTSPEDLREGYGIPRYVYVVTRIKSDGSEPTKLLEYPVAWGGIIIEGSDLKRDEFYFSESGEGGLRVPLGVYRLSDGAKLKHYENIETVLQVANGKAYTVKKVGDYRAESAQIIEINLDNGQEQIVYETITTQGRTWQRNGNTFSESINIGTLKVSKDKTNLYFDEIHNLEKSVTTLKAINLMSRDVEEVYRPPTTGSYIDVETQAATPYGAVVRVNCGGCTTDEYSIIGNEWVFIDPTSGKWQIIQKTDDDVYLSTFDNILISQ